MTSIVAELLPTLRTRDVVELVFIFIILYFFLRFLRKTIAGGVFHGPAMLFWVVILGTFLALRAAKLDVLNKLLSEAFLVFVIAMVIIFQTELRHGIARLGHMRFLRKLMGSRGMPRVVQRPVAEISEACFEFSKRRIGALLVIQRNLDLGAYTDTGVPMDAIIRQETLATIFSTDTVLHDGAVIIRGTRIAAAGCLLPLTERPKLARSYGTRHRAAIGVSEQSDAVVVVVSEESGRIHLVERGELTPVTDEEWLKAYLSVIFSENQGRLARRWPAGDPDAATSTEPDADGGEGEAAPA